MLRGTPTGSTEQFHTSPTSTTISTPSLLFSLSLSLCCSVSLSPSSLPLCVSLQVSHPPTSVLRGLFRRAGVRCQHLSRMLKFLSCCCLSSHCCLIYICILYIRSGVFVFVFSLSPPLVTLSVLSLSPSRPWPGRLSAGWFLLVSRVLLKVSSC